MEHVNVYEINNVYLLQIINIDQMDVNLSVPIALEIPIRFLYHELCENTVYMSLTIRFFLSIIDNQRSK